MKKVILLLAISLSIALASIAQTQQGIVKTPGRLGSNGQVIAGNRLSGATVHVKGRSAVVSGANGTFSFPIPANKFAIQSVKKQGYILMDPEATARQYTFSSNPLILVMDTPDQQTDSKLANEKKIRRSLQRQLQAKENELEALREENRISREEYQRQLQQLYAEQESNEKLISDMAERYSRIDFDQLDEFNLRISDCIINGRLTEADSLLRSKGDINTRIAGLKRDEGALAAEEAELAQRQQKLEKSKAGTLAAKDDIAQDCYNYYQKFLMEHQNDSAAHYLELRASLDTTNLQWIETAGSFICDYLADYDLARQYFERGLARAISMDGEQSQWAATFYGDLGLLCSTTGDYAAAQEYYQHVMAIGDHLKDGQLTGIAHEGIGNIYLIRQDYNNAISSYLKATQAFNNGAVADELRVAQLKNNLGLSYAHNGEVELALEQHFKSLADFERLEGAEHPDVATCCDNIGTDYYMAKDYRQSMDYFKRAIAIREQVLGKNHPITAHSYNNMGVVCAALQEYDMAAEYYTKSYEVLKRYMGDDHIYTAAALSNLSIMHERMGNLSQAAQYMEQCVSIYDKVLDPNHQTLALSCTKLGLLLSSLGDYAHAAHYLSRAMEIKRHQLGDDNEEVESYRAVVAKTRYRQALADKDMHDFLQQYCFVARVMDGGVAATQYGMSGDYVLLEYCGWSDADVNSVFDKGKEMDGKPKDIVVLKDGVVAGFHFEDKMGIEISIRSLASGEREHINQSYEQWKRENKN